MQINDIHFPLSISIVQTNQSIMQSDDNQPRQDDESSPVEHTNGLYNTHVDIVWYNIACLVHLVVMHITIWQVNFKGGGILWMG